MRGSVVGWYPYEFLDPGKAGGWLGMARFATVIVVLLLAITFCLVKSTQLATSRTPHLARKSSRELVFSDA